MDRTTIIDQIKRNDKILSLPQVIMEILDEIDKDDFSSDNLSKIILKDPSLTGRILKLANSPFYHRIQEIKTVHQAVSIIGMVTVKCMALSSSVFDPSKIEKDSGVDPRSFFTYVLSVASASEEIAKEMKFKSIEETFITGLLADIGVLFFIHHYPKQYKKIADNNFSAEDLVNAEIEVFGIDHAEVGYHLTEHWGLPSYVTNSIRNHHNISIGLLEKDPLTNIIKLASLLSTDNFSGIDGQTIYRLDKINRVSEALGISKDKVYEISFSLLPRAIKMAEYLGVDIGDINEMLTKANEEIWKSYLTIENLFKERTELSQKLLKEERAKGAEELKNITMATLSHYLNNAVMIIYGRSQLLRMLRNKGDIQKLTKGMDGYLDVMDNAVRKIVAVIEEMKEISPLDATKYNKMTKALDLDNLINKRMSQNEGSNGISDLVLPTVEGV